ncbi:hypothetical protein LZD49_26275 [Dyadobacter sp. CY261]|uniref:hypothetical protein n=1 Tax=Dyadobacter sp. CY261 TaxID=2907203 RepID=UPI001F25E425|nr:hypothetical protein [Dyadobacter sp. CY261]MCF0074016.1 hypothetical protein [Dyadobacter sp. CY261]
MQVKHIVGIDPDLNRSGLAIWDVSGKWVFHKAVSFSELILRVTMLCQKEDTVIVLEAGWLNAKSNFRKGFSRQKSDRISKNVGENQATGKNLSEVLSSSGYQVIEQKPLPKGPLKGKSWTEAGRKFIQENSGITGRLNDEERDAIYLILMRKQSIIQSAKQNGK